MRQSWALAKAIVRIPPVPTQSQILLRVLENLKATPPRTEISATQESAKIVCRVIRHVESSANGSTFKGK